MDQAHKQVANIGAIDRAIEQSIFPVQDRLLQRPLANIVIQRRAGLSQKQRQLLPMVQQILDRLIRI